MSFSLWVFRKFGVFIVLFYVAAAGVLALSNYRARDIVDSGVLSGYYPAGRSYPRTAKNKLAREILGLPASDDDARGERIEILSYGVDGVVVKLDGGSQETLKASTTARYLANHDPAGLEQAVSPLSGPLNGLLDLHLRFMKRVEDGVGGREGGLRRLIVPKIVISAVYLGLVFLALCLLRRYDGISAYKGGFAGIYSAFIYWPVAVIVVSIAGVSVVDVARHFPHSYYFMDRYVVAAWAAIFAWPLFVAALSAVDVVRSAVRLDIGHALLHAVVLAAGVASIPLVTVGVMFAVLVAVTYLGWRFTRNVIGSKSNAGSGIGARLLRGLLRR